MRRIKTLLTLIYIYGVLPLFAQEDLLAYESWLDSMKRENYIAWEVMLDDLEITDNEKKNGSIADHYRKYNGRDIDQLLHCLPGVGMMRRGNFAGEPLLRGLNSDRYVVSVEGMRMFGACTDKMDPVASYIEPINLKSIDVSFGTQNNMAGAGTAGGLNFNLRKPVFNTERPYAASADLIYNSVSNGFDQSVDVNVSKNKLAFRLSGVHRKAQNYLDGNGNEVRYSQFEKFNYIASLVYRVKEDQLLSFDFIGDDARDVGYPALPMDVAYAKAKMFGLSYLLPRIGYIKNPEIKLYHNFVNHAMDDTNRDSVVMHMDMPGRTHTSGGFLKGDLFSGSKSQLAFKIDYFNTFARAEMTMFPNDSDQAEMFMLTWPNVRRQAAGLSMNFDQKMNDNWMFTTGLRWENTVSFISSDFGEQQLSVFDKTGKSKRRNWLQNYHINFIWTPATSFESTLMLAYGERIPTISEQFGYYLYNVADNHDYVGDPDLKTEKNFHLEVRNEYKTSKLTISSALFAYLFRDYILGIYQPEYEAMTLGAEGVKMYENTKRATLFGGEVSSRYDLNSGSYFLMSLKYVYGRDFESDPLPQIPPLKVNLLYNLGIHGAYLTPEVEWSADQNRVSQKFNERKTNSYWLFNLRVNKEFFQNKTRFEINGGVENIFNVAYREHYDYGNILRPGRNFFVQIKVGI